MLKISKKLSVYISLVLTVLCFGYFVFMFFYMPTFTDYLVSLPDNTGERATLGEGMRALILAAHYVVLSIATVCSVLLFLLLLLVKKGKIFTDRAVMLIRCISWCLLLAGIILLAESAAFTLFLEIGAAVLFVGIVVRVLKNVFEEAVSIKQENDYTV